MTQLPDTDPHGYITLAKRLALVALVLGAFDAALLVWAIADRLT